MKLQVYEDKKNEWRWRLKARNGRIVANGGEGYKSVTGMILMLAKIFDYKYKIEMLDKRG